MLELYLMRHPETIANQQKIIQGQTTSPLVPGWEESVDLLAERLAREGPFSAFFTSDLPRADEAAKRIVDYLIDQHKIPLVFHSIPHLRERHWGEFQKKKYDEVDTKGKGVYQYLFKKKKIKGGEDHDAIEKRIRGFDEIYLQDLEGNVGIMGHQFSNTYLLNYFLEDGDIVARPYREWPNLLIRHLSLGDQKVKDLE